MFAHGLKQPTRTAGLTSPCSVIVRGLAPRNELTAMPSLFGFAPGGVYLAVSVAGSAVRSYRTFSPLLRASTKRFVLCGTFPGVAPAGRYPAPYVIGARTFLPRDLSIIAEAAVRPTDGEAMRAYAPRVKSRQLVVLVSPRGRLISSASNVSSVERSATPSTRSGRKWRWNAVTTSAVGPS